MGPVDYPGRRGAALRHEVLRGLPAGRGHAGRSHERVVDRRMVPGPSRISRGRARRADTHAADACCPAIRLRLPDGQRGVGGCGCASPDPGGPVLRPDDPTHLATVAAGASRVGAILLTHGHVDHSAGAAALHELTGAPVRALDPRHNLGDEGLADGAVISAAGLELRVWATPGHTADSLSFLLDPGDGTAAMVLTGDTILGEGTTVVAYPDGNLADYLASLARLEELGAATVLPGHGPELSSAGEVATAYLAHREKRLAQVSAAL